MKKNDVIKKEALDPGTTAKDGRRKVRAYIEQYRTEEGKNQDIFYSRIISALSVERMGAYGNIEKEYDLVLARYLLNMALCESLYSPIQFCEVALRNSLHSVLSDLYDSEEWYDSPKLVLTDWARKQIEAAKDKLRRSRREVNVGRIVAELHFGFWTSLFEDHYEKNTRLMPTCIKRIFPHLHKSLHNRKDLKSKLDKIRILRNRVFHHERIHHWGNLEQQHQLIMDIISWINPELLHLTEYGDRFQKIRAEGLEPWFEHLSEHWIDVTR